MPANYALLVPPDTMAVTLSLGFPFMHGLIARTVKGECILYIYTSYCR